MTSPAWAAALRFPLRWALEITRLSLPAEPMLPLPLLSAEPMALGRHGQMVPRAPWGEGSGPSVLGTQLAGVPMGWRALPDFPPRELLGRPGQRGSNSGGRRRGPGDAASRTRSVSWS